jgi:iron complex outermembrane receptor protein
LQGQIFRNNDTIKINEVVISRNKNNVYTAGYKKTIIDSSTIKNYNHGTLAEILSENSNIFIKSYGMGGTATPSFRGTGASQTEIDWNGININNPMLGQTDLSLIPVGLIDDIQIYFGGASMSLNSGGIGGIINLETKPYWKNETLISISTGMGSFGHYSGLAKIKTGNTNFQSVTKYFFQSAENDFRYLNKEFSSVPLWETRINSQVMQQGLIQEFYYRRPKSVSSAKIWYQSAYRNLPASLLTQQTNSDEKQFDESLRALLNHDLLHGKTDISFTGAILFDRLNYSNSLASINSSNLSETVILKAGLENRIWNNVKLKIILNEELNIIKSNNYNKNATRNISTMTASAESNGAGRLGALVLFREIVDNNYFLVPDFTAGLQFRIVEEKEYFLKGNISKNSKIPTMNDMFWVPGGNPDLKNEYAFMYELTYEMNQKISDPLKFKYDISIFHNSIKNMIQWHPGQYSYWTADNIQKVNSTGLESSVSLVYSLNNLTSGLNTGYSFTKAIAGGSLADNDISGGKQLLYIPENQFNATFRIGYKNFYSYWVTNFTGKRYITVDNSKYLPGYLVNNICIGIKIPLTGNSIDLNFSVDNLFSANYQSIAYYPLPGRSFFLKILVQLFK